MSLVNKNKYLIIVSFIACFSSFYNLSGKAINVWDESHNAINALEMLQNHNWINYYYAGSIDLWNAKPPLFIWLLCLSFTFLGKTVFALRIIPAIASFMSILVIFKTVKTFIDENKAFVCCLILCTCRGFFGGHTGRTGDFDALLSLLLLLSVYYFLQYFVKKQKKAIIYFFLFTGLAFFVKGPACFLFFPAFLIFLLINKKNLNVALNKQLMYGLLVFLFFPLLYFFIQVKYGVVVETSNGITNTNNSVSTLFIYDTYHRIFGNNFFTEHSWDAFIVYLDVYFFIWYILFYLTIALFVLKKIKMDNPLLLLSCLLSITIIIFYTFMATQKQWYLMPLVPFVAIFISYGTLYLLKYNRFMIIPVGVIAVISLIKHVSYLNENILEPPIIGNNSHLLKNTDTIYYSGATIKQDVVCYLYFLNDNLYFRQFKDVPHGLIISDKNSIVADELSGKKIIYQDKDYLIAEIMDR